MLDLTIRDWMVIVGSLLIVAVIVDAWRRIRAERRAQVRLKIASTDDDVEAIDDIVTMRELPNGGARVLKREDLIAARREHDAAVAEAADAAEAAQAEETAEGEEATATPPPQPVAETQGAPAARRAAAGGAAGPLSGRTGRAPKKKGSVRGASTPGSESEAPAGEAEDRSQPLAGVRPDRGEPANLDWLEDLPPEGETPAEHEGGELPRGPASEVFILHVISRDARGFDGKAILEILLACDLRFGDMDFFHRHEREAGRGPIQFSVANMLKPGVFDIDHMTEMRTRGLVFFLTLPGPQDMTTAFDYMLETARAVARNLDGEVLDESMSALTEQSISHARQQIRDLERRLLAHQS
jgi:cell division protein ZipA